MDQTQDSLYDSYDKNLYRITGDEQEDDIMDQLSSDPSANNSANVQTSSSDIGSGVNTATSPQGTGAQMAGKQSFTDPTDGYFLGIVNGLGVFSLGGATSFITWDGSTLTVTGNVNISQINIPDSTTANSFHVDSSGNAWWGSNVSSGISAANAYITSSGAATFKNVAIGGTSVQYVITNSGIFSYGDGADGAITFDGTATFSFATKVSSVYTLTRDVYFTTCQINNGVTLNNGAYRIFCSISLTIGQGASGILDASGSAGPAGSTGPGGSAGGSGTGIPTGYLVGSVTSGKGGKGSQQSPFNTVGTIGTTPVSAINSIGTTGGSSGQAGGAGSGGGAFGTGYAGGTGGTFTKSNVALKVGVQLAQLLDIGPSGATIKYNNSGSAAGGGGGGSSASNGADGGGGGAGGGNGGIIAIYSRVILINTGGKISSNGGNGGNGGKGGNNNVVGSFSGNGGAGAGGNGGIIILVYNTLTNNGSLSVIAGVGGTGGGQTDTAGNVKTADTQTNPGSAGTIYQFQLSL